MAEITEHKKSTSVGNRRAHMANERTFLAWIRTSIGVMAFGFVLERFALFIKQMSYVLRASSMGNTLPPTSGSTSIAGIFLVGLGALMCVLALMRYKKVERQIDDDSYQPSPVLNILLTLSVLSVGIFLVFHLLQSI
jgi:putative membrane protein